MEMLKSAKRQNQYLCDRRLKIDFTGRSQVWAQIELDLRSPAEMATLRSRNGLRTAAATFGDAAVARSDLQFSANPLVYEETARYELFRTFRDRIRRTEVAESAEKVVRKLD